MIIDKQADFVIRMAKNLEQRSPEHLANVMEQLHPKARKLVNLAFVALAKKRMKQNDRGNHT